MSGRTTRSTPVPVNAAASAAEKNESSEIGASEEILLTGNAITNGANAARDESEHEQIEYLEEDDPMYEANECDPGPTSVKDEEEFIVDDAELIAGKAQATVIVEGEVVEVAQTDEEEEEEYEVAVIVEDEEEEPAEQDNESEPKEPTKKSSALNNKRRNVEKGGIKVVAAIKNNKSKTTKQERLTPNAAEEHEEEEEEEQPTSSARAAAKKEEAVDEDQCRVCTTKEDLVSLFKTVDRTTVADMLMSLCPTLSIARKDFMPQYICSICLEKVTTAVQFKNQCETTERELRKKLSRHQNKLRRPTGFVIIDAQPESDPPSEEEPADEEFKVSDVEASASGEEDSEDSEVLRSKRKRAPRGRGRQKSTQSSNFKAKKRGPLPTKPAIENTVDEWETEIVTPSKKKRTSGTVKEEAPLQEEWPCDECELVFTRKLSLVLHKKAHGGRQPIACEICGKQFKIKGAYKSHMERHNDPTQNYACNKCDAVFMSRTEQRQHLAAEHGDLGVINQCEKCRRHFVSLARLQKHQEGRCPGFESRHTKRVNEWENEAIGKGLFKSVAPLTTTYWSDSFSD